MVGGSDTGVDVGLFGLGTHLFGSGEVTAFESLEFGIGIGHDVGDVFEVGTFGHELEEFGLVDDFLTCAVDEDTTLVHFVDEGIVDALFGLGGSGDVERNHVAGLEESFLVGDGFGHARLVDLVGGEECIVGINIHAEAFGDAGDVASHVTEGEDAEFLAHEFGAGFSVIEVTDGVDEHAHDEFGNGVAVLAGGVHGNNAASGASLEVEVVVTGTSADDDFKVFGVVDDFFGNLVGADDEGVGIGNGFVKVVHVGIFLEEGQGVAVFLNNFADTVDGNFGEGFLGSN